MSREMKHSGIEWIGDIPKEWKVSRLKDIGCLYGGLTGKSGDDFNVEDEDSFAFFIPFTNIFNNDVIDNTKLSKVKVNDGESQNSVLDGDLLFLMSSEDYDGVGKNSLMKGNVPNLYLNSFCKGFRVKDKNVYSSFLNFLMSSQVIRELVRMEAKGFIRINLRQDRLACCPILLPPLSEQQKIADYLDKVCGEIDGLVALQEAMIDELKAYKQSVITEAVTRGLNPNVPLKPSGIDWIGEIPEHWEVTKIKHCLLQDKNNLRVGPFGSALSSNDFKSEGYWVYNQRCVLDNNFTSNDTFVDEIKYNELKGFEVLPGDILITTRGSIGKIAIVPNNAPKGILHPCIIRFVINDSIIDISLLKHIFNESDFVLRQMRYQSNSTTIDVLYSYALKNLVLTLPPLQEQHSIASYLDEKCSEIDSLITIKQQKIEELKDYKISIIYEYVTGKKEVV